MLVFENKRNSVIPRVLLLSYASFGKTSVTTLLLERYSKSILTHRRKYGGLGLYLPKSKLGCVGKCVTPLTLTTPRPITLT